MNTIYHKNCIKNFPIIVLLLLWSGCEKVFDEKDDYIITTELSSYSRGDLITVTIANNSSSAIYYRRCGASNFRHRLVKLNQNDELEITPDACNSFNQMIIEVRDGQTSTLNIPLNFGVPGGESVEGTYQLEITMSDALNKAILPPKNKTNTFKVQ